MDQIKMESKLEQLNIFDFGFNEEGEYVNLEDEDREIRYYTLEEVCKGHEESVDFKVVATFHLGCCSQIGMTLEDIQREILEEVESKTYHFANMSKGIYAYSYKIEFDDGEIAYWFCIENEKHIVIVRHTGNIDDILEDKELIGYPACAIHMFEQKDDTVVRIENGFGDYKDDIRYKILCEEFKILEFSTNRIYPKQKPKDFYEAQFKFSDFTSYWKDNNEEVIEDE